jgi:hypothetical protein
VLIEDRVERLAGPTDALAAKCQELDLRLTRPEAKFELMERMATSGRRALPEKTEK